MYNNKLLNNISKITGRYFTNLWDFLRNFLASDAFKAVGPYLVGGFSIFTCISEAYKAIRDMHQTVKDASIGQRKTRIISSILITLCAAAGIGLATALMVAAAGVAISLKTILLAPLVLPALFASMYSLVLWRTAYIFDQTKKMASRAKRELEEGLGPNKTKRFSPEEMAAKKKRYETLHQSRLGAERQLVFRSVDVWSSAMIVIAAILGSSALLATGAVSFGIAPLVFLVVGVVAGYAVQGFELLDKKHHYFFTDKIRAGLVSLGEGLGRTFSHCRNALLGNAKLEQPFKPESLKPCSLHKKMVKANLLDWGSLRQYLKRGREEGMPRHSTQCEGGSAPKREKTWKPVPKCLFPQDSQGTLSLRGGLR